MPRQEVVNIHYMLIHKESVQMTLSQNSIIDNIISELQELTLINQKVELAGVVGSPVHSNSSAQNIIAAIQSAKDILADKLSVSSSLPLLELVNDISFSGDSKRASGVASYASKGYSATSTTGTSLTFRKAVISGLTFRPKIIIWSKDSSWRGLYAEDFLMMDGAPIFRTSNSSNVTLNDNFKITSTGAEIPVTDTSTGEVTWIAIG